MEWDRHGDMMHLLDSIVQLMANQGLHRKHPEWHKRYIARKPNDFMPSNYLRESEPKPKASITDQLAEYARVHCGNNNQ